MAVRDSLTLGSKSAQSKSGYEWLAIFWVLRDYER